MIAPFISVAARGLLLCISLTAICSAAQGGQSGEVNETTSSTVGHTVERPALDDAQVPLDAPNRRTPNRSTPQIQVPASDLKARVSAKAPAIHITDRRKADSQFDQAQKVLLEGGTASAIEIYESILKNDPRNTDALLGLALIHLRTGNASTAETLILKTLSISPRDSLAHALLSPLRSTGDTAQEESRLQRALADQPDAAPLQFALGNLYARQNRWREAQQAYFKATIGDRDHPDYLFNLAVSLERINQPQAAKQYYQAALAAADLRPPAFSRALATSRVDNNMDRSLP